MLNKSVQNIYYKIKNPPTGGGRTKHHLKPSFKPDPKTGKSYPD